MAKLTTKAEMVGIIERYHLAGLLTDDVFVDLHRIAFRLPDEGLHEATEAMIDAALSASRIERESHSFYGIYRISIKRAYDAMERARVAAPARMPADPPPRYDEVFEQGTRWLNSQEPPAAEREDLTPTVSEADVDRFEHDLLHDFRVAADDAEQLRGFMRWLAGKVAWYSLRALREERWRQANSVKEK